MKKNYIKSRYLSCLLCSSLMLGCELLPASSNAPTTNQTDDMCVWQTPEPDSHPDNCDMQFWLAYWAQIDGETWPERKQKIEKLSSTDKQQTLQKVLLSQAAGTPYQNRLRAQHWLEALMPTFTPQMADFMRNAVIHPSQRVLEMESALVTYKKLNANKQSIIDTQQVQIDKQKQQVEQLLRIEASIIDNKQASPE